MVGNDEIFRAIGQLQAQVEGLRDEGRGHRAETRERFERSEERSERSRARLYAQLGEVVSRTGALEHEMTATKAAVREIQPLALKAQQWEQRGIGAAAVIAAMGAMFGGALMTFKGRIIAFFTGQ